MLAAALILGGISGDERFRVQALTLRSVGFAANANFPRMRVEILGVEFGDTSLDRR